MALVPAPDAGEEAPAWRRLAHSRRGGRIKYADHCTESAGSGGCLNRSCRGCPGTRVLRLCASATGRVQQLQLDVFGEIVDAMFQALKAGMEPSERSRTLRPIALAYLATAWHEPDEGIWEVRGGRQHFVHSKVMAWVAFDRAANQMEVRAYNDSADRWRAIADEIHAEVCQRGFDGELGSFVQAYGSKRLDASLLLIPLVGFLPPDDPRIRGTLRAIEEKLLIDAEFVLRYETDNSGTASRRVKVPSSRAAFG